MPSKPGVDANHWLYRLSAEDWLAAADTEMGHVQSAFGRHAVRPGLTHARRAAGMAMNALLWLRERPHWGRSYMEHVVAIATDTEVAPEIRAAAAALQTTPATPPALVPLRRAGEPDATGRAIITATVTIIDWAKRLVGDDDAANASAANSNGTGT